MNRAVQTASNIPVIRRMDYFFLLRAIPAPASSTTAKATAAPSTPVEGEPLSVSVPAEASSETSAVLSAVSSVAAASAVLFSAAERPSAALSMSSCVASYCARTSIAPVNTYSSTSASAASVQSFTSSAFLVASLRAAAPPQEELSTPRSIS
mgnify:CR=1 FL=1